MCGGGGGGWGIVYIVGGHYLPTLRDVCVWGRGGGGGIVYIVGGHYYPLHLRMS